MAQVFEYALVVLASSMFAGASVATYSVYSSFQAGIQLHGELAGISDLANRASLSGSASGTFALSAGNLSCADGELVLSTGSAKDSVASPPSCSFSVAIPSGTDTIRFFKGGDGLTVTVS